MGLPQLEQTGTRLPRRKRGRSGGIVGARRSTLILTLAPAVLLMFVFLGLPAIQGIRLSFSSWPGFGDPQFVGLANYTQALFDSPFIASLLLTAKYAVASALGIVIIATLLAAAVSAGKKGSAFYRVVWFLPGIAPVAAVGIFWATAFQPTFGVVNVALGFLGLGNDHQWLADENTAIYPAIFVTIWASVGFAFLLILGSMEQIPVSTYEAARIDGAGTIRTFFSITLPLIRPVLAITAVLELIWQFNGFTIIWGMTQGGPGFATSTLPVVVYKEGFQLVNFGLASAMAVLGSIVLIVVGLISLRLSRSQQEEH
jgi:ABC-type sugar transport system permease subunit